MHSCNAAKNLTHFTNSPASMLLVGVNKTTKHLHYTISGLPRTAFSKPLANKCLYIPVNLRKKFFVPET